VGRYAESIAALDRALAIRARHWLAKSNEAAGNKDKAEALYKDISMYNFNGIDYALKEMK
jgi:lipoprotein NlpI